MAEPVTRIAAGTPTITLSPGIVVFYNLLGVLVLAGLLLAVGLGLGGMSSFGLFTTEAAFAVGGMVVTILSAALVLVLFTLARTIFHVRQDLAESLQLRERIEDSYARLESATRLLAEEIQELRGLLPTAKQAAKLSRPTTIKESARMLSQELQELKTILARTREQRASPHGDPSSSRT